METTSLQDELLAVSRAVTEAERHIQRLRTHAASSWVARRLDADVRRVREDLAELAAETTTDRAPGSGTPGSGTPGSGTPGSDGARQRHEGVLTTSSCAVCSACCEPAPGKIHDGEPAFQPECDDEGVAGGWQRRRAVSTQRRRRTRVWV